MSDGDKQSKQPGKSRVGNKEVIIENKKGEAIEVLVNVPDRLIDLLSTVKDVHLSGTDYQITSRSLRIDPETNDYCLTVKTSHASTLKAVKDRKTRKWIQPDAKAKK